MFFEFIHAWSKIIHCFFFYYRPRWTTVLGTKYKIGCILQYGYSVQRDLPLYGKVRGIYVFHDLLNSTNVLFLLKPMFTRSFAEHFNGYVVENSADDSILVRQADLTYYLPLHLIKIDRILLQNVVVPRFYVEQ